TSSNLPDFPWTVDKNKLIWDLIGEMEKPENSKVLFGKKAPGENTSGDKKVTVYKRIGENILPEYYKLEPGTLCAKRLQQTGGGVGVEPLEEEDGKQYMAFYIPPTGPDCTTAPAAANIWQEIEKDFVFFTRLHKIFATRPNVTPIAISTGLGPGGPTTLFYQPPDELPKLTPEQFAGMHSLHDILTRYAAPAPSADTYDPNEPLWTADDTPPTIEEVAPVTPAPRKRPATQATVKKENVAPTPSAKAHGPKALQQEASLERAKASFKKVPNKRSPLDMLLSLQEYASNAYPRATSELRLKQKQHLLEELRLGVWTPAEYRKKVKKLDKQEEAPPPRARAYSPDWDSELPSSDRESSSST
ncbi:hypothetical protein C8R46DRAFT_914372, partial [Mycena filopes]